MGGYKEHKIFDMLMRKRTIIGYSIIISLIFIISITMVMQLFKADEKSVIYTGKSDIDYKVFLKDNEFFQENYLTKDNQYISSLIDYINVYFNYELNASEKDVDYEYAYKVDARILVEDKDTNKALYNSKEELIPEKIFKYNTNKALFLNEKLKIDYNQYNELIKKFLEVYDLNNIRSTMVINMYVNVLDGNEKFEEENPTMSISIPLTLKTMAIDIETNELVDDSVNVYQTINREKYLFLFVILFILDVLLIIKLLIFIKDTKDDKAIYKMRLKRIMSNYGSYVQKINNEFCFDGHQILEMKSFEDLLQIKDTINKPILMIDKSSAMETYFFISEEEKIYVFELSAGYLRNRRSKKRKDTEVVF